MALTVRVLNCATLCPPLAGLLNRHGKLVCACLLIETARGLVLVDTGLGTGDVATPRRLGPEFRFFTRPRLDPTETAIHQVRALGYDPREVRHIVLTHLDLDHAGGLGDFPWAKVHVLAEEHAVALAQATGNHRQRYRPAHWAHGPDWAVERAGGETWNGFKYVRDLAELNSEIMMIPLDGHTPGHAGVAVQTTAGWWLHAGDAFFHNDELSPAGGAPALLRLFQRLNATDNAARLANVQRLRALRHDNPDLRIFCAHDPEIFAEPKRLSP